MRLSPQSLRGCATALALASSLSLPDLAPARTGESFPDFARDGAWCWFSDPRAVADIRCTYAGWVTAEGSIVVGAWDHATGAVTTATLHERFERDDHDNPALLLLPDGRLAAFYSLHARGDMRLRLTARPGAIDAWEPERALGFDSAERGRRGTTYAYPVLLADEDNTLLLFWRGSDFKPTFAISHDLGRTWSAPRALVARPGADDTNRPYLKLCSDGRGRIDFVFTDGHPRDEPTNSVYYLRYERGAFFRADGTRLGGFEALPLDPARCDRVYDGASAGRAWVWDIALDAARRPVIAYTRLPAENDHRYAYARWDGEAWRAGEVCAAGGWFPQTPAGEREREPHYSGGMALDPADPATLYTSRRISEVFEIERWTTRDGGRSWKNESLTRDSARDNVRPFCVRGARVDGPAVLWMNNERYVHYTEFRAALKAWQPATTEHAK